MKVLLVNPSRFFSGTWGSSAELSHLLVLYSHLRARCPEAEIDVLDLERELGTPATEDEIRVFLRQARAALEAVGFDVIGISCWTSLQYLSTLAVAELAKELFPECRVVVGGYHPTACPEDFEHPGSPVDDVVVGEGEVALEQMVKGKLPVASAPRRIQGHAVDLDRQELLWGEYKYYRSAVTVPIWISRGCPFSCSFCLDRLSRWRALDPRKALAEIRRIVRQVPTATHVDFMDPIFGLAKSWRREFLDLLIAADLPLRFWGETRADLLEDEDVARLGALDFQMDIGLDAVSPRMVRIMRKAPSPGKYLDAFRRTDAAMSRHGVSHQVYLIVNYPGETLESLRETWAFCRRHVEENEDSSGVFSAQPFKYFPGNEIHSNLGHYEERYGTRVLHPGWWKMRQGPYHVLSARVVASRDLAEANALFEPYRIVREINALAVQRPQTPGAVSKTRRGGAGTAERAFEEMDLRLRDEVYAHETGEGRLALFSFETGARYLCDERETEWVRRLREGRAAEPWQPEQRTFCRAMAEAGMLRLHAEPPAQPASGAPEVEIQTALGALCIRLLADEAPLTVACFLQAVRLGLYREILVEDSLPGVCVRAGGDGPLAKPPFTLPAEPAVRPVRRGSLIVDVTKHPFHFCLARRAWPGLEAEGIVCGEVTEGLDVLDALLRGDRILDAQTLPRKSCNRAATA